MKKSAKRIGELVLRTSNVAALTGFYTDVIGLELYASFGNNSFLKVAEDFDGHPQMLALFDKSKEFRGPHSIRPYEAIAGTGTLHHFAFAMEMKDFKLEVTRLHELGLLHMIHPSNLTPELLADRILAMLDSTEPPSMPTLDFRGMDRLGDEMQLLVNDSVERQLTMEAV